VARHAFVTRQRVPARRTGAHDLRPVAARVG
jgi:hypothetical protein